MRSPTRMHLGAFLMPSGHHIAGWRLPGSDPAGSIDISHYTRIAQIAERGLFDMVFIADAVGTTDAELDDPEYPRLLALDPLTALSAMAGATERVGLVGTATTTFAEPFDLARRFASLDLVSAGRAGWNIVTSFKEADAWQYGLTEHVDHELRYARATEFVEVVTGLWDSWDEDAFPRNTETGRFFRPGGARLLEHRGQFFSVRGPLNVGRSPQGSPVLVQAGSSPSGVVLGGGVGEVIFTAQADLTAAIAFNRAVKSTARERGRDPRLPLVLPGLLPIVGRTRAEAESARDRMNALIAPHSALAALRAAMPGLDDVDALDPHEPMPEVRAEDTAGNGNQSRQAVILADARARGLSVLETARMVAGTRGHHVVVGTPKDVADRMEEWFAAGACDGFNVMAPVLPGDLETFVELVVPELQRRGLFRTEYESRTLRGHLGLSHVGRGLDTPATTR